MSAIGAMRQRPEMAGLGHRSDATERPLISVLQSSPREGPLRIGEPPFLAEDRSAIDDPLPTSELGRSGHYGDVPFWSRAVSRRSPDSSIPIAYPRYCAYTFIQSLSNEDLATHPVRQATTTPRPGPALEPQTDRVDEIQETGEIHGIQGT